MEYMDKQHCNDMPGYRHHTVGAARSPPDNAATSPCSSEDSQGPEGDMMMGDDQLNVEQRKLKRIQANKRERKRMHTVNDAFDDLRDLVPTYPSNRKLSKIETLRLACAYIQDLAKLLADSTAVHGEDVSLHHCEGFMPPQLAAMSSLHQQNVGGFPSGVKSEFAQQEYNSCNFQQYRVPMSYDYESCPSDPEIQSPPHYPKGIYIPPGLAVKPPALARVSSDTAVSLQMAQTSLATSCSSGYGGSPVPNPCSPLTRVQHSSPSLGISHHHQHHNSIPSNHYFNGHHHHHQVLTGYTNCYSQ
jgi:hypothetical protein